MKRITFSIYFSCEYLKELFERNSALILILLGALVFTTGLIDASFAQTGKEVFGDAASNIACKVIPGKFGAMLTIFAGAFAIVAAAAGSYKGAWTLLFVSIGAFIFKEFVSILFGGSIKCS